ncbi:MAG: UbiA-like polyprenyltransferase [Actinomycetota bacterium]
MRVVPALLGLVRFAHTVFALPFALAGAFLARHEVPGAATLGWILLAMVGARSLAMAVNRLVDARIDALNPRTQGREIPSGRLSRGQVTVFAAVSLAALLVAVSRLPEITWYLWPIPVAGFVIYPYTKRFTWLCHLVLGVVIGLAPVGGWIAVTGEFATAPILLGAAVALWIAGFDVIYALLDIEFDRAHGVRSVPARFGPAAALAITGVAHAAAVALLVGAGLSAGAGIVYLAGVGACALVLAYENVTVAHDDPGRIARAFGASNMVVSLLFFAFTLGEVTLSS